MKVPGEREVGHVELLDEQAFYVTIFLFPLRWRRMVTSQVGMSSFVCKGDLGAEAGLFNSPENLEWIVFIGISRK